MYEERLTLDEVGMELKLTDKRSIKKWLKRHHVANIKDGKSYYVFANSFNDARKRQEELAYMGSSSYSIAKPNTKTIKPIQSETTKKLIAQLW